MKNSVACAGITALIICASLLSGYANGYKVLNVKSTKATAMGEAFIAQSDDPSAIAFNPAGLAQLKGEQVSIQSTFCNLQVDHTSPSGEKTSNLDKWEFVPALYATSDFGLEDVTFGLGVTVPNGLSTEWAADSFARYVATYSSMTVVDIAPAVAWKATDRWLLGGSVSIFNSAAKLQSMMDFGAYGGAPGLADATRSIEGDGMAWSFTLGAIHQFNSRHSVALTYRHPYSVEYDGELSVAGMPNEVTASIEFPPVAVLGYAYKPTDKWTVEVDLDWTGWNAVGDITLDFDSQDMADAAMAQDLHNAMAYKFGAQYRCTDRMSVRGGYIYNENATPDETWRPSLPDTVAHLLSAGIGYDWDHLTLEGALQLVLYEDRTIDNNVDGNESASSSSIDGKYSMIAPCVSMGASYRF